MTNLPFNPVDIGVVLIVLMSGALAFWRGFLKEILSIIAWVGAVVVTLQLLPMARPLARDYISIDILADSVAAAALFLASLVVLSVVSSIIAGRIRSSGMNTLDRSLGVLFGLLRGLILVSLGYLAIFLLYRDRDLPEHIATAQVTPAVHVCARLLLYIVPEELSAGSQRLMSDFDALGAARRSPWGRGATAHSNADSSAEKGYKTGTRKDLDRLIRRTQNE
jgi:membrane protein required for colicin V production